MKPDQIADGEFFCERCLHAEPDEDSEYQPMCEAYSCEGIYPEIFPDDCPVNFGPWGAWRSFVGFVYDNDQACDRFAVAIKAMDCRALCGAISLLLESSEQAVGGRFAVGWSP